MRRLLWTGQHSFLHGFGVQITNTYLGGWWWRRSLIPAPGKQRQGDLCAFETSLVCRVSARTVRQAFPLQPQKKAKSSTIKQNHFLLDCTVGREILSLFPVILFMKVESNLNMKMENQCWDLWFIFTVHLQPKLP